MATWLTHMRARFPGIDPRPFQPTQDQLREVTARLLEAHGACTRGVIPWRDPWVAMQQTRELPACPLRSAIQVAFDAVQLGRVPKVYEVAEGLDPAAVANIVNEAIR